MPYSDYLRCRVLVHHSRGLSARAITDVLSDKGLRATRQGIAKFLRCVDETGSLERQPRSGRPSSIILQMLALVEDQMRLLCRHGHVVSLSTVLHSRFSLGWTYCQMICEANKAMRLHFTRQYLCEAETGFTDVIFTDETTIQLEGHRRFSCMRRAAQAKTEV